MWAEFLKNALEKVGETNKAVIKTAIADKDFLHAAEWIKSDLDERWEDFLRATFQTPSFEPADIHSIISDFDSRIVFTLNFEDIYERKVQDAYSGNVVIKSYRDPDVIEYLRGDSRYVVKVHGSLNSPDSIILTQKDYAEARSKYATFYRSFDAALLTNTFLFIGCGLSDPDVGLLLENQNFNYQKSSPHYMLAASPINEQLALSMRNNRNLKLVEYDPVCQNHSGLVEELRSLLSLVTEARESMSENLAW
jgi:hypothetical protein